MRQFNRQRVRGSVIAVVGYILSPLSWWNDLLVNIPLAYAFGTLVGLFDQQLFVPALVVGYWLTNVAGFVLLHVGGVEAVTGTKRPYGRRELARDFLLSVGYTVVVVLLANAGWLALPEELLP
jgi:hypothetical protein